ncbi:MAG: glycosyltransferase family 39 protein [Acidobacteriota bacterium]
MIDDSSYSAGISVNRYSPATIVKCFIGIAAVSFILRIFYAGDLYQDDGLWFTAAEEILRGKALYREMFFDKPPGLPLLYAGLFKTFGAHIITIRLFTICYAVVVSVVLYLFGSWLYDKPTGLTAAVMFSVFSTTYISGDMQSLNTDFLMMPFYAAGAYLLIRSGADFIRPGSTRDRSIWLAFAGGAMVGVASQINPKAIFDLIFFALFLIAAVLWKVRESEIRAGTTIASRLSVIKYIGAASKPIALTVAGFVLTSLPFLLYIAATQSLSRYKLYVWDLSSSYARYYPVSRAGVIFLRYGTDYFLINNTLFITLVVMAAVTIRQVWRYARGRQLRSADEVQADDDSRFNATACRTFTSDAALLMWFAVSFAGVATGGRFFAHYYFQVLPSLCLIGARGLVVINMHLRARNRLLRGAAITVLITGFLYTLVRSHSETAGLAVDWVRGKNSVLNREARIVAAMVRDIPDPANTVDRVGVESIREGGPRTRAVNGSSDYLFIWGNWPEIYYRSGLLPASGYLAAPPLTGIPADVQYGKEEYRSLLYANLTAAARTELARDMEQTQPKYIVDQLGFLDRQLSIERYPELHELMNSYERYTPDNSLPIYIRRVPAKAR